MKNLFHLSALVLLTGALVSCSKSTDQLADSDSGLSNTKMARSREAITENVVTSIYPEINQPRPLMLGNFDSYLFEGDQAVFYVVINGRGDLTQLLSGTLTMVDESTGELIQTIDMIPYYDPAATNLSMPPGTVMLSPYMLANVTIDSQYAGKTITLLSSIQMPDGEISSSALQAAFLVQ